MESSVSWWVAVLGSNAARVVSLSLLRPVSSFPFRQSSPTPGRGVFCVFPERLVFFSLWPLIRSLSGSFWVCYEVEYKFIFFVRMYHSSRIFCWKNLPLSTPAQWHFCCQPPTFVILHGCLSCLGCHHILEYQKHVVDFCPKGSGSFDCSSRLCSGEAADPWTWYTHPFRVFTYFTYSQQCSSLCHVQV